MQRRLHATQNCNIIASVRQFLKLLYSVFVSDVKSPKNAGLKSDTGSVNGHDFAMYILKARTEANTSHFHTQNKKIKFFRIELYFRQQYLPSVFPPR